MGKQKKIIFKNFLNVINCLNELMNRNRIRTMIYLGIQVPSRIKVEAQRKQTRSSQPRRFNLLLCRRRLLYRHYRQHVELFMRQQIIVKLLVVVAAALAVVNHMSIWRK